MQPIEVPKMVASSKEGAEIKVAVDAYIGIQKARCQARNRINMFVRDFDLKEHDAKQWHARIDERLFAQEKELSKEFKSLIENFPIYLRLIKVRGVAQTLAAQLIASIQDPARFKNVAKLWKYAGLGLNEDGTIQKRAKGKTINYNPFLKMLCWKLTDSWNKHHQGYYGQWLHRFWEEEKDKNKPFTVNKSKATGFLAAEEGIGIEVGKKVMKKNLNKITKEQFKVTRCKGHVFNRAKRKTAKLFLSQLWATWMRLNGLTPRPPYCAEKLGHKIEEELPTEDKKGEETC